MNYADNDIIDNEAIHNFEFFVDGHRSFIDYKTRDNRIYLIHTEVPEELEGRGIAGVMVEKVLTYIEQRDMKLVPLCAYVKAFLKRHPEWNRLLA
ncbi:N-acetyltransferase [Mucilaginibacter sp. 14171R-50]|uniref:GNAT family N-acetyltransferase n=1 Tax=Mucilaginibacter sp. 14171R-50 TaxID=2703789 RepID=UPI00138CAFBB|nr:GNAT family N-acetyltransferase [Mucilaginibacter sp. 14171R-50]QHS57437.1 N-acetyltransferase [Mucilaginibacter sp. 14171R-50]